MKISLLVGQSQNKRGNVRVAYYWGAFALLLSPWRSRKYHILWVLLRRFRVTIIAVEKQKLLHIVSTIEVRSRYYYRRGEAKSITYCEYYWGAFALLLSPWRSRKYHILWVLLRLVCFIIIAVEKQKVSHIVSTIEARLRYYYRRGEAENITYCEYYWGAFALLLSPCRSRKYHIFWVFVRNLVFQDATSMPRIVLSSMVYLAILDFSTLSHKRAWFFFKKLLNIKQEFWFSVQLLFETFLIVRRIQWHILNVNSSSSKVPVILVRF